MKQDVILVLDCGATNVRAMAVDRQGKIIARAATANASDIAAEKSDWHQWSLEAIMQRFADCCRQIHDQLASCTVRGITVTTFGVDGALVDEKGALLYPIISWKCPRTAAVMEKISQQEADACLNATRWCPAVHEYFRGGGFSSRFLTRGGVPFTMTRVNIIKGLGPVLQIAEGWSVELPKAVHDTLDKRTDSSWPTTWFAPRLTGKGPFSDVYSVMANWGANHGVLTVGHVGADFITLAAMLRIPVCMHNVEAAKIYRPSAWAAHGMDIEGQDYRACQNYGPLYKR